MRVCDLITSYGDWNWPVVNQTLWEVDREELRRIPIGFGTGNDTLIWRYTFKGEYTVKSGYFLAQENDESTSTGLRCGFSFGLRKMWKLQIPSKIKIHLWRVLFNALPVRTNLVVRGMQVDILCQRCKSAPEDIMHTFWYCQHARKVWKKTGLWSLLHGFCGGSFGDVFNWVTEKGHDGDLELLASICWSLWFGRNQLLFYGKNQSPDNIIARASNTGKYYKLLSLDRVSNVLTLTTPQHWQPPPIGVLKINVDAAVKEGKDYFSVGLVGRDSNGHIQFVDGKCFQERFSPHISEMIAVKEGVSKAAQSGWTQWIIETDALTVINAIKNPTPFSLDAPISAAVRSLCPNLSAELYTSAQEMQTKWHMTSLEDAFKLEPIFCCLMQFLCA